MRPAAAIAVLALLAASISAGEWPRDGELPPGAVARFNVFHRTDLRSSASVSFSPDGKLFCFGTIRQSVWSTDRKEKVFEFMGAGSAVFSKDSKFLASHVYGHDLHVQWFDLESKQELPRLEGHEKSVSRFAFSNDGKYLATGIYSNGKQLILWDTKARQKTKALDLPPLESLCHLFTPDSRHLLLTNNKLELYRVPELTLESAWDWPQGLDRGGLKAVQQPDERTVLFYNYNGQFLYWDLNARAFTPLKAIPDRNGIVTGMAQSRDKHLLIALTMSKEVAVFEAATMKKILALPSIGVEPGNIDLHPEGKWLAVGYEREPVIIFDLDAVVYKEDPLAAQATPEVMELLYTALGGEDLETAYSAIRSLASHNSASIELFKRKLKSAPQTASLRMNALFKNLASPSAHARRTALDELGKFGHQAGNGLRESLNEKLAEDAKQSVSTLLTKLEQAALNAPLTPEIMQQMRVVFVLERMRTPAAAEFLKTLSGQTTHARIWFEANRALRGIQHQD